MTGDGLSTPSVRRFLLCRGGVPVVEGPAALEKKKKKRQHQGKGAPKRKKKNTTYACVSDAARAGGCCACFWAFIFSLWKDR